MVRLNFRACHAAYTRFARIRSHRMSVCGSATTMYSTERLERYETQRPTEMARLRTTEGGVLS